MFVSIFRIQLIFLLLLAHSACTQEKKMVLISTGSGDMKVRLYDETPLHRDNFLKLAGEGYYDGVIFHRVINHFMIQAGDPESKNAAPGASLGNGGPGYTIPAEFVPGLFHKKGALAAARTGDQVNPRKESSGSQFYIVQGKVWRQGELDTLEMNINGSIRQNIFRGMLRSEEKELNRFRQENNQDAFNTRIALLQTRADSIFSLTPRFSLSEEQRRMYTSTGGYPPLDGSYTVFGEIVEGIDVLDKIAAVETDKADRPLKDIKIRMKLVN